MQGFEKKLLKGDISLKNEKQVFSKWRSYEEAAKKLKKQRKKSHEKWNSKETSIIRSNASKSSNKMEGS